tara:strand:- start:284 stop:808 length:525 start_codon:yes stop_codon:yes gene_type:complete
MHKLSDDFRRRIISAIAYPFIDKQTNKSLLVELHGEAFNSNLCKTCENEHIRAYIELYRLINPKEKSMTPPSKKYRFNPLRENEKLSLKGMRGVVTADTLTDDVANLLISKGIYRDLIVTVEEAEAIKAKTESDSKVEYSEMTIKSIKAALKEAGVDYSGVSTRADLIALAEAI